MNASTTATLVALLARAFASRGDMTMVAWLREDLRREFSDLLEACAAFIRHEIEAIRLGVAL